MNADEIIGSGLLEAHALGQTSASEADLVERSRKEHPRVEEELNAIEVALETYAIRAGVAPPQAVRGTLMKAIRESGSPNGPTMHTLPERRALSTTSRSSWLMAASVAGLLLSAGLNFVQYRELRTVRGELAQLENDRSVLAQELQVQRTSMERANAQLAVLLDADAEVVRLNGSGAAEGTSARIYWDRAARAVHFDPLSIPPPPEGKQYQLWALVDGQPVDAGMIALEKGVPGLQRMKDIPDAQAFAVTIEKAGGSPTPNLSALVLMGQV